MERRDQCAGRGKPIESKVRKFEEYLEAEGRNPDDIERSWLAHVLVCEDDETVEVYSDRISSLPQGEKFDRNDRLWDAEDAREKGGMLVGTLAEVAE